jgi:hypothetical protein
MDKSNNSNGDTHPIQSNTKALLHQYIESLSEKELKAYHIAKSHLGSSFSLEKSKGFIDWKAKITTSEKNP